ncbi:MAG: hypothetical protein ACI4SC_02735, partial [Candidatus Neoclostridium sp.]
VEENRVEATCMVDGCYDSVVYCSVCGAELSRTTVKTEAIGHDWGEWTETLKPTCTSEGSETRVCANDSTHKETRALAELGHELIHHNAKAPTCTEIGWNEYDTCSRCDYTTYSELPATGHTPATAVEENRVEATCMVDGRYDSVVYCSVCKEELSREEKTIPALGHKETGWIVDKEATCTEAGSKHKECSVCHEHLTTETIVAHGHEFGEWTTVTEPTTNSEGKMIRTCKNCGCQEEKTIDKLPKRGCSGSTLNIGDVVVTLSILALALYFIKRKR